MTFLKKPNDEDMTELSKKTFFNELATLSMNCNEGYHPPPWNVNEFPEKTEGWIEFQKAMRKDPNYYHSGIPNGVGYET